MDMSDWKPYFHISFDGGIFLFPFLRVASWPTFLLAATFTALVCWLERLLTLLHSRAYVPAVFERLGRPGMAGWRAGMYGVLTLLRLLYMLVAMTFHVGLLLVTVFSLASSQFVIEYGELEHLPPPQNGAYSHVPTSDELPYSTPERERAHGYPPSAPSSARRAPYHPYARARGRSTHKAHRSSVSLSAPAYPDAYGAMQQQDGYEARGSPFGPRAGDPHAAWPYVPDGWAGGNGERGKEREEEDYVAEEDGEEGDHAPLEVKVGKSSPGLWGEEARDRAREIMSGRGRS
ncbi:hypothetical protein CALCODRAFT_513879 [Calocera cornea HHB12733]|uniref:Copper transporter n=1 Tax=Calocera cornea HHB12733 TaxID=1353952 RepID=A0A165K2Q0_9BASI|nr:hypothetical protein CALCODRAFT_513879 [Calocera cornea HHB12733]